MENVVLFIRSKINPPELFQYNMVCFANYDNNKIYIIFHFFIAFKAHFKKSKLLSPFSAIFPYFRSLSALFLVQRLPSLLSMGLSIFFWGGLWIFYRKLYYLIVRNIVLFVCFCFIWSCRSSYSFRFPISSNLCRYV